MGLSADSVLTNLQSLLVVLAAAMASLAEGIQGLVKNMRNEQQMLRDWIEAQQVESRRMRETLDKLSDKIGEK